MDRTDIFQWGAGATDVTHAAAPFSDVAHVSKAVDPANTVYTTLSTRMPASQQISAPSSLTASVPPPPPPPPTEYPASLYSVIGDLVKEAMGDDDSYPRDEADCEVPTPRSDAAHTPLSITPRSHSSALPVSQLLSRQQQQQQEQQQRFSASQSASTASTWLAAHIPHLPPNSVAECPFSSHAASLTAGGAWPSQSQEQQQQQQQQQQQVLTTLSRGSIPTPAVVTPRHSSVAAADVPSGVSTPVQLVSVLTQADTASSHASFGGGSSSSQHNSEVVLTGAIPAGAQPSSNAATHYKTKRCRHFDQSGWCPYQHRCVFAHGDREFAVYTARKNEATAGAHPKTSQQVKDHIARNVHQLVEEYEQAVAEAAAAAKAKSTAPVTAAKSAALNVSATQLNTSALGTLTGLTSTQSSSQLSSAASQQSNMHLIATSPLASASMMAQASGSGTGMPIFPYQAPASLPQQQQQQFTPVNHQPMYITAAGSGSHYNNNSNCSPVQTLPSGAPVRYASAMGGGGNGGGGVAAPGATAYTLVQASGSLSNAAQPIYLAAPQQQQQQQILITLPSSGQGIYQLQQSQPPPQQHPQQQQQQQFYVVEAPYYQTVQLSNNSSSIMPSNVVLRQAGQGVGSGPAFQTAYVSTAGGQFY